MFTKNVVTLLVSTVLLYASAKSADTKDTTITVTNGNKKDFTVKNSKGGSLLVSHQIRDGFTDGLVPIAKFLAEGSNLDWIVVDFCAGGSDERTVWNWSQVLFQDVQISSAKKPTTYYHGGTVSEFDTLKKAIEEKAKDNPNGPTKFILVLRHSINTGRIGIKGSEKNPFYMDDKKDLIYAYQVSFQSQTLTFNLVSSCTEQEYYPPFGDASLDLTESETLWHAFLSRFKLGKTTKIGGKPLVRREKTGSLALGLGGFVAPLGGLGYA